MVWLVRALGTAVVGGMGWKLGNDIYDALKKRMGESSYGSGGCAGNPVEAEVVAAESGDSGDSDDAPRGSAD